MKSSTFILVYIQKSLFCRKLTLSREWQGFSSILVCTCTLCCFQIANDKKLSSSAKSRMDFRKCQLEIFGRGLKSYTEIIRSLLFFVESKGNLIFAYINVFQTLFENDPHTIVPNRQQFACLACYISLSLMLMCILYIMGFAHYPSCPCVCCELKS